MNPPPTTVVLRVPEPDDADRWHALFHDAELMRHVGDGSIRDLGSYRQMVARERARYDSFGFCLFSVLVDGEVAGFAGAHQWAGGWGPVGEIETGWRLGKKFWGRGLATEAVRQLLDDLDARSIDSLVAMIRPRNTASLRLAERFGFGFGRGWLDQQGVPALEYRRTRRARD